MARSMLAYLREDKPMENCMKKYLVTLAALGLCTSVLAQSVISGGGSSTIVSRDGSTVSAGPNGARITSGNGNTVSSGGAGSVILDNQSSVTSSTTIDSTGTTSSSIMGSSGSMCSAVNENTRCEISCQAPQVAQCARGTAAPICYCQ